MSKHSVNVILESLRHYFLNVSLADLWHNDIFSGYLEFITCIILYFTDLLCFYGKLLFFLCE